LIATKKSKDKKFCKEKSYAKNVVEELDKAMGFNNDDAKNFYKKDIQEQTALFNLGLSNLSTSISKASERHITPGLTSEHVATKLKSYNFKSIYTHLLNYLKPVKRVKKRKRGTRSIPTNSVLDDEDESDNTQPSSSDESAEEEASRDI
jgi:hypothetical protein